MSFWGRLKQITPLTVLVGTAYCTVPITIFDVFGTVARVFGESMQPTLNPSGYKSKDMVFLSRWKAKDFVFQRGEVVSFLCPYDTEENQHIKRILALEGDTIVTRGYKKREVHIPEGHCWVEGDNSGSSIDSNKYGPVPLGIIQSKATHIVWPPSRWQRLVAVMDSERVIPHNVTQNVSLHEKQ